MAKGGIFVSTFGRKCGFAVLYGVVLNIESLQPSPAALKLLQQDRQHVLMSQENVLVVLWRGTPDAATCHSIYDAAVNVASSHPTGKISVVSILYPNAPAPSASARQALEDLYEDPNGIVHRIAVVLPDTGFVAAAIRGIILSATQRSARRQGHGVFPTLAKAVSWAIDGLPTLLSVAALLGAVEQTRSLGAERQVRADPGAL